MRRFRLGTGAALLAALLVPAAARGTEASAVASASTALAEIDRLDWLAGCWSAKDGASLECWLEPAGGLMLGLHRDLPVEGGGTASFEFLRIGPAEDGADLAYFASPQGRPATAFSLVELTQRRVVFRNPDHDYPQEIRYRLEGDRLVAEIAGAAGSDTSESRAWTFSRATGLESPAVRAGGSRPAQPIEPAEAAPSTRPETAALDPAAERPGEGGAAPAASSKTWLGREHEVAETLRSAEPVSLEPIGVGVTQPFKATLAHDSPVRAFAWKPIRRGVQAGFFESYHAEVAAYELDRLLGLDMVPVTVERRIGHQTGAAALWVEPSKTFKELGGAPTPPAALLKRWNIQLIRAKMFDNLIHNVDPNLGNWLVDPAWNIILIDHSRAFTEGRRETHELIRVDADLWERMRMLDEAALTEALGQYLTKRQIRSLLKRRDRMAETIARLVADRGEAAVMVRYGSEIR